MGKMGANAWRLVNVMLLLSPFLYHASLAQMSNSCAGGAHCESGYSSGIYESTDAYYGSAEGNCESPGSSSSESASESRLADILSPVIWEQLRAADGGGWNTCCGFRANSNGGFSYNNFISAASAFPSFGTAGNSTSRRRDIAAFFAHACHGFHTTTQANPISKSTDCDLSRTEYPCAPGKAYYGRGPFRLTGNNIYGAAGKVIGQDLLDNPDLVTTDPIISFQTALWFWTTAQKPSCHDVIDGTWSPSPDDISAGRLPGFGVTINLVNGETECGSSATADGRTAALDRITRYERFTAVLGVDSGSHLNCQNMEPDSSQLASS